MRILVVDDDVFTVKTVTKLLIRQNYIVDTAIDGQEAWELARLQIYNLIVLDVLLPKLDGIGLCRKLREEGYSAPILLLTGCSRNDDRVNGLDAGADDYVVKPFDWQEFLARIRALLRREGALLPSILYWGALSLNPQNCEVRHAGKLLALRPREYKLLEMLLRNPNRVFSSSAILENLWSFEDQPSEDAVRAHIKGLRQKLKSVAEEELIETVYGLGYRLRLVEDHQFAKKTTVPSSCTDTLTELQQAVVVAWEDVKPEILERVKLIEDVAYAIDAEIAESQWQGAIAAAHQLAGTVGAYGFKQGSYRSRQIELLLHDRPLNQTQRAALKAEVVALRQELSAAAKVDPPSSLIQPRSTPGLTRILAIDDDPHILKTLKLVLEPWGLSVISLSDPQQVWQYLETAAPDLLLLDIAMPKLSGLAICEQVRNNPRWAALPVMVLTAHTNTEMVQQVFMAGADDFVMKPIVAQELVNRVVTRIERYRFWQRLTERDPLTQLPNRLKFTQEFHQLLQSEHHQAGALVILNIDLKSINYQYGYSVGDWVLKQVAALLSRTSGVDLVARWSGSKFAIAKQSATIPEVMQQLFDVIRLSEQGLTTPTGDRFTFTIHTGGAQSPEDGEGIQALYQAAELALAHTIN